MAIRKKITNSSINALKPDDKRLNDSELSGFHARITPKGRITYFLFYRHNGKQQNVKLGTHPEITPAQARDAAKMASASIVQGVDPHENKKELKAKEKLARLTTLQAFIDLEFEKWYIAKYPKSGERELKNLKVNFPNLLPMQLRDINASLLEKLRTEMLTQKKSNATINRRFTTLKSVMSRAVDWEVISSHDLRKIKPLSEDNSRIRYLSFDEEERLKKALSARDFRIKRERESGNKHREERGYPPLPDLSERTFADYLEPLVILAMNTGMRKGELLSLTWQNVNLEREFLSVIAANAKSGKTRHIPLNQKAKSALTNWKSDCRSLHWVFEGEEGQPLKDFKKAWSAILEAAKIKDFRFHDLRHHFASKLVMAGVDLNTTRELLGHGSLDMTLRYSHLAPEHKARAVNLL
ncbi:tyrosine-type recombinase/integrase [Alteromonas sp. 345S023]|uniref:Tyrosine-type recombinase/integrase n=1 Tax=Alteromonas profundi TaxID=2696062 RepID=A0A7X5RK35_9ALTE|nr:tyrosine-type recombinase/integrase [Alteromonas profundi]NDV90497.1 tyrosine-type recombinase/integrase [Alteromonas profundi]